MIPFLFNVAPWFILICAWLPSAWLLTENRLAKRGVLFGAAVAWLLVVQGDSLLGPFARMEWGDGDRLFQGYFPYLAKHMGDRFLPDLMGGVDRYGVGRIGGEYFSVRLLLLQVLPLWLVTVLLRFAVAAVAMNGIYLFCRRLLGASRELAFSFGMLFSVSLDFTATLTFLYGFSLAGIPLLLYFLFTARWGLFALFGALYIGTSDPIYWLPLLWVCALALRLWIRPSKDVGAAAALALFSALWLVNYADMLLAFRDLLSWSDRTNAMEKPDLIQILKSHLFWLLYPVIRFNHLGVLYILPIMLAVYGALVARDLRSVIAVCSVVAISIATPFLTVVSWDQVGLGVLTTYRWYWEYGVPALALFACAQACVASGDARLVRFAGGGAAALALSMLFIFKGESYLQTLTRGNLSSLSSLPGLESLVGNPARTVVLPTKIDPNMLVSAGLSNYDGGATLVHRDVHRFWSELVILDGPKPGRELLGFGFNASFQSCCAPLEIDAIADLDMLRLANVGFIVSYRSLSSSRLDLVSGPTEQRPTRSRSHMLSPAPPPFIYKLRTPLPLIYAANGIGVLPDELSARRALLHQDGLSGKALIAEEYLAYANRISMEGGAVAEYVWRNDGFDINLRDWRGGPIIVNVPYLPWWRAHAESDVIVRIVPANIVQMAILVPPGARAVRLEYRRPLFMEHILGLP